MTCSIFFRSRRSRLWFSQVTLRINTNSYSLMTFPHTKLGSTLNFSSSLFSSSTAGWDAYTASLSDLWMSSCLQTRCLISTIPSAHCVYLKGITFSFNLEKRIWIDPIQPRSPSLSCMICRVTVTCNWNARFTARNGGNDIHFNGQARAISTYQNLLTESCNNLCLTICSALLYLYL